MTTIYSSSALKTKQREVKDAALKDVVHITENGWRKYVFMSEDVLRRTVEQAVEDALYEKRLADALAESRADFEEGRCYASRDEMMAAVAKKREALHA